MKKTLLAVIFVISVLLATNAYAGRYWATVATIGTGAARDAHRPAFGNLRMRGMVVAAASSSAELVLVVIDDADEPVLQSVAAHVWGHGVLSDFQRASIKAEARRLGAKPDWNIDALYIRE